jgi:hypothetical protein
MNMTLASLPIDTNTLILIVVAIVSGISTWLEKKRKAAAGKSQKELTPAQPSPQEPAPEQPDMEEILRRLFGGQPPARPSAPPTSLPPLVEHGRNDPQPMVLTREDTEESGWREDADAPYETVPSRVERAVDPSPILPPPPAILHIHKGSEQAVWHPQKLAPPLRRSSMIVNTNRRRRSREGDRAISQFRHPEAARSAFVASLVFGPPKAFESPQP